MEKAQNNIVLGFRHETILKYPLLKMIGAKPQIPSTSRNGLWIVDRRFQPGYTFGSLKLPLKLK